MIGAYVGFTMMLTAMSQIGVLPIWVVLLGAMIGAGIWALLWNSSPFVRSDAASCTLRRSSPPLR